MHEVLEERLRFARHVLQQLGAEDVAQPLLALFGCPTWPPASPPAPARGRSWSAGSVAEAASPEGVSFVALGQLRLKGFARSVRVLDAGGA